MAERLWLLIAPALAMTVAAGMACAASPAAAAQGGATQSAAVTPDPYVDGSVKAGAAKAAQCFACHGPKGNSTSPTFPRLAGQNAVYIDEQLRLFRAGIRQNPMMSAMASGLTDQNIDDLSVYFAAQRPSGLEAAPTLSKSGRALYLSGDRKRDVPACVACHGPTGRGNPAAGYPALQAQHAAYVLAQLQSYADGTRYSGPHAETATPNSIMMFTIAKRLSPAQMQAVASYVQGLR